MTTLAHDVQYGFDMSIYTADDLRDALSAPILLFALLGDSLPAQVVRLSRMVERVCPALLPDFGEAVLDRPFNRDAMRGACWDLMTAVAQIRGAWEVYAEARRLAADQQDSH